MLAGAERPVIVAGQGVLLSEAAAPLLAFAEACMAEPLDQSLVSLPNYKGIRAPYDSWEYLDSRRSELAALAAELDLSGEAKP